VKIRRMDAERELDGHLAVAHLADRFPRGAAEWRERRRVGRGLSMLRRALR
jgi:hypothetical protein